MADSKAKTQTSSGAASKGTNKAIIALVVLVVIAVGAVAYLSGQIGGDKPETEAQTAAVDAPAESVDGNVEAAAADIEAKSNPVVKPGNPIVAKVDGRDITRLDIFNFIQTLPANTRQLPPEQLFPLAVDQVVASELIGKKVKKAKLDNDPIVKEQLEAAKQQIVRGVFMQKEVQKAMTDERLQGAYKQYAANFPEVPEVKTRHILVKEEAIAKDVLKKLNDGGDFIALAKEHSVDATKDSGGELGYISKQDQVIPEYLDAAFTLEKGEVSAKPVKSEFGYHIIEVLDTRNRPPAPFEQAKPFLAAQMQNAVLNELLGKWRAASDVEIFDINGEKLADKEPAAGE